MTNNTIEISRIEKAIRQAMESMLELNPQHEIMVRGTTAVIVGNIARELIAADPDSDVETFAENCGFTEDE